VEQVADVVAAVKRLIDDEIEAGFFAPTLAPDSLAYDGSADGVVSLQRRDRRDSGRHRASA
jgi:hypothetical protein